MSAAQVFPADHVAGRTVAVVAPVEVLVGGVPAAAGDRARSAAPGGLHLALDSARDLGIGDRGLGPGEIGHSGKNSWKTGKYFRCSFKENQVGKM